MRRGRPLAGMVVGIVLPSLVAGCGSDQHDPRPAVPAPTPVASSTSRPAPTPTIVPTATSTAAVAWATGSELLRSDDGGFTWTATSIGLVHAVSFVDRDVGWITGASIPGSILATVDGGTTWTDQGSHVVGTPPVLADVVALDERRAVAVGLERRDAPGPRGPVALFTDDGGTTWQRATLPSFDPTSVADVELRSVCVAADGAGLATGTDFTTFDHSLVLVTRDGGRSWQDATSRLPARIDAVAACGLDGRLWFLGAAATVLASDDGGETWQDRHGDLPPVSRVRRGAFLDGGLGWIVATSGVADEHLAVYVTTDDGATWEARLHDDAGGELVAVGFDAIDDSHAVVVAQASRPLALPRSSFGRSWSTRDGHTWLAVEHPAPIDFLTDVDLVP